MKFYAYESVRFHNPRPILTLIGMLFLALDARGSEYCNSSVTTFLAFNTSNGAQLVSKNSDSGIIETISFEGLYLSSAMACGMNYRRCPNLTVIMRDRIVVVVIPLQTKLGLVSYNRNDDNYFTFREKYVLNIRIGHRNCHISTISHYYRSYRLVVARCLNTKTNVKVLNSIDAYINTGNLSSSFYGLERFCIINSPSEIILFVSGTFQFGLTVFIDSGQVKYQKFGDHCETFTGTSVCTDVLRFTSVTSDIQAIYCEDTTYLIDTATLPEDQIFPRDKYGLPFFCSKSSYYSYFKSGTIFYQSTTNKWPSIRSGFIFNRHNVVWGECVNNAFVVMLTSEGIVFSLTVEKKKVIFIGLSQTIPRIFGTTVLMNNLTHAIIYDLYTSRQLDVIKQEFVLGYVARNDDSCMTFSKPERITSIRDVWINITSGWLMIILMAPVISVGVVYTTRKSRNAALGSREKGVALGSRENGNSPELDQADTNMILQIPRNVSGPPHSFTVNNSPELDSVIQPGIV